MTEAEILTLLEKRFSEHPERHKAVAWVDVAARLQTHPEKVKQLIAMEESGGEPDVVRMEKETGEAVFFDCSAETPAGRRNTCYDGAGEAERNRKGVFPSGNAVDMAGAMGATLLTEEQYRALQQLGAFDLKTSSWLLTPVEIRKLDGALFADRRYGHVFVYHNSAPSFYGVRGFRACLKV